MTARITIERDRVDSTQDEIRRHFQQHPSSGGFVWARADEQNSGRGRQGRTWLGTQGALMISAGFTLPSELAVRPFLLPFLAGLSLFDSIEEAGGDLQRCLLKWPNDLICVRKREGETVDFAKLAGILCETQGSRRMIVGWGVNLTKGAIEVPASSSLLQERIFNASNVPAPRELASRLMNRFEARVSDWLSQGTSFEDLFLREFESRHLTPLIGCTGDLADGRTARIVGLAEDGALRVRGEGEGHDTKVVSGAFTLKSHA